jgi:5-(carboxyamino)imidazole ribonucleotide mutase
LSAVQILSRAHPELADRLEAYHDDLQEDVGEVSRRLHEDGTEQSRMDRS